MKKLNYILGIFILVLLFNTGCDPREEAAQPKACFDYYPTSEIKVGDNITFTNCSTDGETYDWDFDDGGSSVSPDPIHSFDEAGVYDVTLLVENKNLRDEVSQRVTVISSLEACFTVSPNPAEVNEILTFTNCSTGADSYEWDIDGNGTVNSREEVPLNWMLTSPGTYDIKLKVISGSQTDEISHTITINDGTTEIDPTVYDLGSIWLTHYYNDFSTSGDWLEDYGETWTASIANGFYTITDNNASSDNYGRYYYTNAAALPSDNYDIDVYIRNTTDNGYYGSGIAYGMNATTPAFNYYRFSVGLYNIGDTDGTWTGWVETSYGNTNNWNLLTVRKYLNKYYYFINEVFIYSDDYNDFDNQFGFVIDKDTHVDIDEIGIWIMDLSGKKSALINSDVANKKSGDSKQKVNTTRIPNYGKSLPVSNGIMLKK